MTRLGWSAAMLTGALVGVAGALAPSLAAAEIYGWVDPSGDVTYSNLPPPKNARVIDVIQETPPPSPKSQAAAEAAHQAEMQRLNDKLQQLERELQQSRWQASAPPPPYPVAAAPSYYGAPPSYAPAPSYGNGCDPEFFGCNWGEGPINYSVGVVPFWWDFRHHRHHDHDRDRDRFDHGFHRFPGPVGGPHFVSAPHSVSMPHSVSTPHSVSMPHVGGGSGGRAPGRGATPVSGPIARGR